MQNPQFPATIMLLRGLSPENAKQWITSINDVHELIDASDDEDTSAFARDTDLDPSLKDQELVRLVVSVEVSGLHGVKAMQHPLAVLSMSMNENVEEPEETDENGDAVNGDAEKTE